MNHSHTNTGDGIALRTNEDKAVERVTLSWKVKKQVPVPCPDNQPDPYTGEMSMIGCAVYHFKVVTEEKSKTFDNQAQADLFIKNAPPNCTDWKSTR